jgi:WD40 repeat protein
MSDGRHGIVTAATNGAIVVWDLSRGSGHKQGKPRYFILILNTLYPVRVMAEHSRSVNRVAFHPSEAGNLISASQDGTMRIWDLRTKDHAKMTLEG